jgi:hypothetical protein
MVAVPPEFLSMGASSLSLLASTLSIAASVKRLLTGEKSTDAAIEEFKKNASKEEVKILDYELIQDAVAKISVISQPLLSQLAREAQRCEDNHLHLRENATTQIERDRANIRANECMCTVLRDIKRYNQGVLPGKIFENWWASYSCTD